MRSCEELWGSVGELWGVAMRSVGFLDREEADACCQGGRSVLKHL